MRTFPHSQTVLKRSSRATCFKTSWGQETSEKDAVRQKQPQPITHMNENTSITICVCTFIAFAFLTIGHGCAQSDLTQREAIKAGLVQKTVPLTNSVVWGNPQ